MNSSKRTDPRARSGNRRGPRHWIGLIGAIAAIAGSRPAVADVCAYTANEADGTVSVIDTAANEATVTIPVGSNPTDVAAGDIGDGIILVYVTNRGSNTVSVIDPETFAVETIPVASGPERVATDRAGNAYVSHPGSGTISVIDGGAGRVTGTIEVGGTPRGLAPLPDGQTLLVADSAANQVVKVDLASKTVVDRFTVGAGANDLAVNADGHLAFVNGSRLVIIRTDTGLPDAVLSLLPDSQPRGIALTPNGALALLCVNDTVENGNVKLIATDPAMWTFPLPAVTLGTTAVPVDVAVTPDSSTAYVTDSAAARVVVVDTAGSVRDTIAVGNNPQGIAIASGSAGCRPPHTPTPTATAAATPTVTPNTAACPGDCNGDGTVAINELIVGVNIALGASPVTSCPAFDRDGDENVAINELIAAVNAALTGCPQAAN